MKTLRLFGMALVAVLMCVNFASCSNEENVTSQGNEEVTVSLGFGGDFEVSESPLSRNTMEENNDLYFIMVYHYEQTANYYAYGLFDKSTEITIKLIKNEKYRFVAFIIKDGKNKIEEENNKFSQPFNCELNNKFIYEKHSDYLQSYTLKDGNEYYIANIEIYSGLLDNYIPSGNGDISIPMARFESFGAEFEAEDFSEGVIQITLESDKDTGLGTITSPTLSFEYPTTNISEIFSVLDNNDMLWNDSDLEATLNVTWIKADNTEVILGNPTITFKRDCKTTIKFSVESTNDAINFDIDESELGDGGTYVVDGNTTTKEQ